MWHAVFVPHSYLIIAPGLRRGLSVVVVIQVYLQVSFTLPMLCSVPCESKQSGKVIYCGISKSVRGRASDVGLPYASWCWIL